MSRAITDAEIDLLCKLVGDKAPFFTELQSQLANCIVEDVEQGGLDLKPVAGDRINANSTVLGSGSIYDVDDEPVIFDLLQYDGYIAKLLIERADSIPVRSSLDYRMVKALGFGQGITLER
jgi:hypothetical protein